jgi:hypothetical protein
VASIRWAAQGVSEGGVVTVTKGAGTANGDRLVVILMDDETSGHHTPSLPQGAGTAWTTLSTSAAVADTPEGRVFEWEVTNAGSLPANWTFTPVGFESGAVWIYCIQDLPSAAEIVVSWANGTLTSGVRAVTAPSITTYTGSDPILLTAHAIIADYANPTFSTPTGMTARGGVLDGEWMNSAGFSQSLTGTGATGDKASNISLTTAFKWRAVSVAIPSPDTAVSKNAAESLTIADSAAIAVPVAATESITITDSAGVGIPTPASDAANIAESVSIAGELAAAETAQIADLLGIEGTLGAADAATISDTPAVGPLALDTLAVSDAVTQLVGHLGVTDPVTISDGAAIETLFGDLVVALFAVDPDSGALLPLPDHKAFTVSRERNGAGAISLTYPVDGLNFAVLRDTITTDRDLEVEIWTIGQKTGAMRGFLQEASGDDVKEDRTWSFSGGFAELLMGEAVAWPAPIITITTVVTTTKLGESNYQIVTKTTTASSEGGPPVTTTVTTSATSGTEGTTTSSKSTNGDLEFKAVTPGELMTFLVEQAQDRDALDGLELGFTATHDSAGVEWPDVITTKFSPGSRYDSMLSRLVDFGLAEWGVTWTGTAYRLDLWVIFGRGVDRTTGLRPVVLRKARNLIDAPRKWSVRDAGTAILAAGGEGVYEEASDADALARRGRRIERSASANNLTDAAAVQAFAQNQLHLLAVGRLEVAHGIGFLPGEPRPVIAFDIGDWIYSQSSAGLERLRVVQWTLSVDDQGPSGTVTLNDTITDWLSRLKAMIDNLTSGDTVVGTSQSSPGQDSSTPLPPEVLSADSIAFLDGTLGVRAAVTVAWEPPVLNVDGTVITDLDHFNVQFALATSPDVWNAGITANSGTADHATFTAPAGQTITIRVNAVDRNGNTSVWSDPPYPITTSDDDIPPPVPSDAVVSEFLGTVRISWDGLTADGAIMYEAAIDFDHIEVHLSPGSLFTPDDSTLVGRMYGLGTFTVTDLPYGVEQFARFVAVDWSGNRSDPSGQGSATPAQVVEDDVFDGAIGTAKLQDAAIVTAKIANLAVNDAKIGSLSVGKLTAGSLNADVILASGGIKTATSGTRVELDSAGLRLYNGSNTVVDLKTSNGSALVVGEFRTSLTGQRIVFNPGGALADQMNFYPSAAGDFARIMSRTAPSDGTAAILIDGGAANGTSRGRIGAYKSEAFISYVTNDAGGDTTAGFSRTAVSASNNTVLSWVQTEFDIDKYSGNSRLSGSRHRLMWVQTSGNWFPVWRSEWGSGIKLDNGNVVATNDGTDYVPFHCSTLVEHSSIITKQDIVDIDTHFDPDAVMAGAPGKGWRYRDDVDRDGDDAFVHFGPLAEDLPEVMHRATNYRDGTAIGISLDDKVGVIWETVRRLLSRVDQIESTIDTPESE